MPVPSQEPARRRVLFVDDEAPLVSLAAHALSRAGYDVIPAHNGRQALDALRRDAGSIDAIILDLVLPDISGAELLQRMRAVEASVPIIVASGLERAQAARLAAGMAAFLHKPYSLADLRATLDQVIRPRR